MPETLKLTRKHADETVELTFEELFAVKEFFRDRSWAGSIDKNVVETVNRISEFNRLPWYKRIFAKI